MEKSIYVLVSSVRVGVRVSLLHVSNTEDKREQHAEDSNSDVADGKEVVLTTKCIGCADHEALRSLEWKNLVVVVDLQLVLASFETLWNSTPQLSEVWKTGGPHPDNEVSYLKIMN